jgi:hypothetical protein
MGRKKFMEFIPYLNLHNKIRKYFFIFRSSLQRRPPESKNPEPGPLDLHRYLVLSCVVYVPLSGGGKVRRKDEENTESPVLF